MVCSVTYCTVLLMDLIDFKLKRLEADYEETIAAGKRAEERHLYEQLSPIIDTSIDNQVHHAIDDVYLKLDDSDDTPEPIEPVPYKAREEEKALGGEKVNQIKTCMGSIKLSHEPSWAKNITDDQLVNMLRGMIGS